MQEVRIVMQEVRKAKKSFELIASCFQLHYYLCAVYSKDEASQLKQTFWTSFGQYISPQLSAGGLRVNWVNYKTGIKHLYFKMQADKRSAYIAIEMTHPDVELQQMMFEQFTAYRVMLESTINEVWDWQLHSTDEHGKTISRVMKELPNVSVYNQQDWPALISFFKPRMIALDEFWNDAKDGFDDFR